LVKRVSALVATLALVMTTCALAAPALAAPPGAFSSSANAAAGRQWSMLDRFAREAVQEGDADSGTYFPAIEHVRELQYRLRWAGVYTGPVTGYFGGLTRAAVRRFQTKAHLPVTGVATHATWERLIPRTLRGKGAIRPQCRGHGWNLCYDRARHQVTLWRAGSLWNSWLVRGGARGYETRTGSFRVYWRDRDHVSGIYKTPMPYSQFFSRGQAFHGSPFMTDPFVGHSHGCVNMYIEDARQLWKLTAGKKRVDVRIYGAWD
jgi:hypothetical protein